MTFLTNLGEGHPCHMNSGLRCVAQIFQHSAAKDIDSHCTLNTVFMVAPWAVKNGGDFLHGLLLFHLSRLSFPHGVTSLELTKAPQSHNDTQLERSQQALLTVVLTAITACKREPVEMRQAVRQNRRGIRKIYIICGANQYEFLPFFLLPFGGYSDWVLHQKYLEPANRLILSGFNKKPSMTRVRYFAGSFKIVRPIL